MLPETVPTTTWNVVRVLGEGAFGEVKLVVDSTNSEVAVAMKCIDLRKHPDVVEAVRKEALLMRMLRDHANVVQYIGMRVDEQNHEFQIFLGYVDGGELFDQIEPDVGMPPWQAQFYFRQLINGLYFIHSFGIAHRDIKPENLLLTKSDVLKISDFGMATVYRHKGQERLLDTRCGTLPYVAPEVLNCKYKAQPADVWSCGIVLVAMLAGELPWDSPTCEFSAYVNWIQSTGFEQNPWKKITNIALSLLRAILTDNVPSRATIERIKQHPWYLRDFCKENKEPRRMTSARSYKDIKDMDSYDNMQRPPKRRKHSLSTLLEHENESSASQPVSSCNESSPEMSLTATRFISIVEPDKFSYSAAPPSTNSTSFSQPANMENMLLNYSQIDASQSCSGDPLQNLVRRMTRFCVTLDSARALQAVVEWCENCDFKAKKGPGQEMILEHMKKRLSFVVNVYEIRDGNKRMVMVDCRLSRGDGLEFKRAFILLKQSMASVICKRSQIWMEMQGLVCSQAMNQLSLSAGE